ncbi:hypothetical protein [Acinetobacter pittii]|uniref:hypothetical protein n=1 Tax=Acinetobacter pittii TaxID=48296 RepID=UPI0025B26CAA|nr:hypothetical protein [Acinetobacter pittii]
MNKFLIIATLSCLLLGCGKTEKEKLKDERQKLDLQVQKLVKEKLKDGDTAKFRNQWELCGEVNAKNSFGAYTGYQRYIVTKEKIYFENDYNTDSTSLAAFNQVWSVDCKK